MPMYFEKALRFLLAFEHKDMCDHYKITANFHSE